MQQNKYYEYYKILRGKDEFQFFKENCIEIRRKPVIDARKIISYNIKSRIKMPERSECKFIYKVLQPYYIRDYYILKHLKELF